jgi:hypothetical protein
MTTGRGSPPRSCQRRRRSAWWGQAIAQILEDTGLKGVVQ